VASEGATFYQISCKSICSDVRKCQIVTHTQTLRFNSAFYIIYTMHLVIDLLTPTNRHSKYIYRGRTMAQASHRGGPGSITGQSMWDLWWTKWHWDRLFPEYFGFPPSISFYRCSITWKNETTNHLHHRVAQ
jgi:hypothetical protein